MKIRIIVVVLSLLAFLSTGLGGYLYYSASRASIKDHAHSEADLRIRIIASRIDANLSEYQKAVKGMAGIRRIALALRSADEMTLGEANHALDYFREALNVDVCYVMNREGVTIASSNRNEPDSFVGKSYRFRPYFGQAINGTTATYMALGVTSGKRGIYFSHPVIGEDRRVLGVVVIKAPIDDIQREFSQTFDGSIFMLDPKSIVFSANRPDLLYRSFLDIPESERSAIRASKQFGTGPLEWTGIEKKDDFHMTDRQGRTYRVHERGLTHAPGWKVVYLHDMGILSQKMFMPLFRASGYIIIFVTLLTGLAVFYLYGLASEDIRRRKKAEEALEEAHRDLALRVEERTADLRKANAQLEEEISGRVSTEEALSTARDHLQAIYDASPDMILVLSGDGRILDVNANASDAYGYSPDEMRGLSPADISGQGITADVMQEKISLAMQGEVQGFEWTSRRKSGDEFPAEVRLSRLDITASSGSRETGVLAVVRDISEKKKIEEQLHHSQKMEAIGLLAAGIAHDFNNILGAMVNYIELLRMKCPTDHPTREFTDQIFLLTERATNLTRGLLAFSRRQETNLAPVDLNEILARIRKLLERVLGEDIEIVMKLEGANCTVMADSLQIEQVLMNLATNARDAMPGGGRLTVATAVREIGRDFIQKHGFGEEGLYAVMSFSDTGTGMDEETMKRIFDPFFTTKEVGKGTGLGLAMVYGIIKEHKGYIIAESEPGRGTTFRIYLPFTGGRKTGQPGTEGYELQTGRGELVLLGEDDRILRDVTTKILENVNYRVVTAKDGEEAILRFREHQDEIALVLLDVIMPKINGKEVASEVRKIRPGIPVLFMSGYPERAGHRQQILSEDDECLTKPVTPLLLLKRIRELLQHEHT